MLHRLRGKPRQVRGSCQRAFLLPDLAACLSEGTSHIPDDELLAGAAFYLQYLSYCFLRRAPRHLNIVSRQASFQAHFSVKTCLSCLQLSLFPHAAFKVRFIFHFYFLGGGGGACAVLGFRGGLLGEAATSPRSTLLVLSYIHKNAEDNWPR